MQIIIIPRKNHNISRKNISKNALKVLHRLNKSGHEAYLVGGSVRDLLLGKSPKDFDVATNATPEQMQKLFRNCRLVGRRFRLAHVIFEQEVIEVATFRRFFKVKKVVDTEYNSQNGMLLQDNIFGTIEEDAKRRDLTINSLYYSAKDFTIRDYVGGLQDLQSGIIRLVGDPATRYREDPVRMLRVIRFAARLNMVIAESTAEPIPKLSILLNNIPPARLFEESLKLLQTGYGYQTYLLLREYQLFHPLFPIISNSFSERRDSPMEKIIKLVLKRTDIHIQNKMYVHPAFLFATMFWYLQQEYTNHIVQKSGYTWCDAFLLAMNNVLNEACQSLAIPKYITALIRDIWKLQIRISHYSSRRNAIKKLIGHSKFHAAYDLLMLRAKVEDNHELKRLTYYWKNLRSNIELHQTLESQRFLYKFHISSSL